MPPASEPEEWVAEQKPAKRGSKRPKPRQPRTPRVTEAEAEALLGDHAPPRRRARLAGYLREAADHYDSERYKQARTSLKPVLAEAGDAPAARELNGLIAYRSGQWRKALAELEAVRDATGTFDHHPVIADCQRALGRLSAVEETWDDLRRASPAAELVTEGRIVMAHALADEGRLADGVRLLEQSHKKVKRPRLHHLRQWYALADLYERSGELARARDLFAKVARHEPDLADVGDRIENLG